MQLHHCYFKPIRIFFVNFNSVKPLNSGHLRVLKNLFVVKRCPRYWEAVYQRLSHLGLHILSAIQGMSTVWDARFWEVSLFLS